ncbi:glycosyltransferase family 2 protein [Mucilaginibacter sp. FT3.2]|uniref:glycosyltransferase family 2 protein n=1 Tax=Mucilaginibacter sp. FT3.2 TaxID=2723090 RepID=UPI0016136C32|nr:glycosyltransferase family 2 protein [Mucilaginibacter sp. FT3.2]MBB6231297.1 glycosyltransferase involved in cell wall biosynthesis [Mucilaginibacter sp. FT3.2]
MDQDLVSIIMPAYNAAEYIAASIESVLNQTYANWELLVIDDGSTDNTAAIVNQFKNADRRIKYLYQQNGRQGKARNLGIKHSSGTYIAFLDADDKWTADKLTIQINILFADKNTDLLFSQGYSLTGSQVEDYNVEIKDVWNITDFDDFIAQNRIPILSVLAKKEVLLQVNGFTENNHIQNVEDYHLWLKLLIGNKIFKSIPNRLFYYRIHSSQSTFNGNNTATPVFYVYQDLFNSYLDDNVRGVIIDKLKWFIFNKDFHLECLHLIISHLNYKGKAMIAFIIKKLFAKPKPLSQKAVFNLVSVFG